MILFFFNKRKSAEPYCYFVGFGVDDDCFAEGGEEAVDGGGVVGEYPVFELGEVALGEGDDLAAGLSLGLQEGDLVGEGFDLFFDGGDKFACFGGCVYFGFEALLYFLAALFGVFYFTFNAGSVCFDVVFAAVLFDGFNDGFGGFFCNRFIHDICAAVGGACDAVLSV